MNNSIYPCLWFDNNAAEAAAFYKTVFEDVEIHHCTPMVVSFNIKGKQFMGLNGGSLFKPNPSISFFAICSTEKEVDDAWNKLSDGGMIMMPLNQYPWSEKYGFIQDKYNVSWQLSLARADEEPTVFPSLMFTGAQSGKAQEAINFYTTLFKNSETEIIAKYEAGEQDIEGNLKYGQFMLDGQRLAAMDSSLAHSFTFDEGVSLVVTCDTQEEIDFYWLNLSTGGKESRCGWCQDSYGVWWQIIPSILASLMTDPAKADKVGAALMQMGKLDIAGLIAAGNT